MQPSTIFIGGLGGSGTRAIAAAVARIGYFPGFCLNSSNDNLIFTELFKRPDWVRSGPTRDEIADRLCLLGEVMVGGVTEEAVRVWPRLKPFAERQRQGFLAKTARFGWMMKEPNAHIFVESILEYFDDCAFIYVSRHPLDMALSGNRQQLHNWGWMFDIDAAEFSSVEEAQLEYWIATEFRRQKLSDCYPQIASLRFEDFVRNPVRELRQLVDEWQLDLPDPIIHEACSHVVFPETIGRHKAIDCSIFRQDQLDRLRTLGEIIE